MEFEIFISQASKIGEQQLLNAYLMIFQGFKHLKKCHLITVYKLYGIAQCKQARENCKGCGQKCWKL